MDISIINMAPEHIGSVIGIERDSFSTPWPKYFFSQEIQSNYGLCFVAVFNVTMADKVAGYICARTVRDQCAINKIACHFGYRRKGIASILVKYLMQEASRKGIKTFFLEVRESNAGSQKFYQKIGFIMTGIHRGYYTETGEDAIVMEFHV